MIRIDFLSHESRCALLSNRGCTQVKLHSCSTPLYAPLHVQITNTLQQPASREQVSEKTCRVSNSKAKLNCEDTKQFKLWGMETFWLPKDSKWKRRKDNRQDKHNIKSMQEVGSLQKKYKEHITASGQVPALYIETKEKVMTQLKELDTASIITDSWTSRATHRRADGKLCSRTVRLTYWTQYSWSSYCSCEWMEVFAKSLFILFYL